MSMNSGVLSRRFTVKTHKRSTLCLVALFSLCVIAAPSSAGQKWKDEYPEHPMPRNEETGKYEYQEVVDVEGTQAEIYSRARVWVADRYVSARSVIELEDEASGVLVIKGLFGEVFVRHTVRIEAREGRYRCTISGFVLEVGSQPFEGFQDSKWRRKFFPRVAAKAEATLASLKSAMSKPAEDW